MDEARLLPRFGSVGERQELRRGQALAYLDALPAAGDPRRFKAEAGDLRGIPVVGFGVGGVSPGTKPGSDASLDRCDRERERVAA